MIQDKIKKNDSFAGLTEESFQKAQAKLDTLCKKHGLTPWKIQAGSGKARWKDLVLAQCGIELSKPQKPGRKKLGEDRDKKITDQITIDQHFGPKKKKLKTSLSDVAARNGLTKGQAQAARDRFSKRHNERTPEEWGESYDPDFPIKLQKPDKKSKNPKQKK